MCRGNDLLSVLCLLTEVQYEGICLWGTMFLLTSEKQQCELILEMKSYLQGPWRVLTTWQPFPTHMATRLFLPFFFLTLKSFQRCSIQNIYLLLMTVPQNVQTHAEIKHVPLIKKLLTATNLAHFTTYK